VILLTTQSIAWAGACPIIIEEFEFKKVWRKVVLKVVPEKDEKTPWKGIGDRFGPEKAFLILKGTTATGVTKRIMRRRLTAESPITFSWKLSKLCKNFVSIRAEVSPRVEYASYHPDWDKDPNSSEGSFTLPCPKRASESQ
jgi:hypothetical protein